MQSILKTIIVTGSNQGIGRGIVQNLASKSGWKIIMACRNLQAANKTKDQIKKQFQNADIVTQEVDIADEKSVDKFTEVIKSKYGSVDILFNNAAIYIRGQIKNPKDTFQKTLRTNFYGTVNLTDHILPYINQNGKIINMTSKMGTYAQFSQYPNILSLKNLQNTLTRNQLYNFLNQIQKMLPSHTDNQYQAPYSYGLSKLSLNLYTKILSKDSKILNKNIQIYSMHPGFVSTNMNSYTGTKSINEGIQTGIYLIQLPNKIDNNFQGGYFSQLKKEQI